MKKKYAITTLAALAFVVAGSMYAGTASAEDTMKSETPAQDHMKGDPMKGDHMKGDAMKGDAMKSGHAGDEPWAAHKNKPRGRGSAPGLAPERVRGG